MIKDRKKASLTKLAHVRWFDSSITQGDTRTVDDAAGILENESVGIVVHEDKNSITLALDRCIETGGLRCTICIPKVNVRRIRRFKA